MTNWDASDLCGNAENCNYDLSGEMLELFYGTLRPPAPLMNEENIRWVHQWSYVPSDVPFAFSSANATQSHNRLLEYAPVYVPKACQRRSGGLSLARARPKGACRLHVNYHGCTDAPTVNTLDGWNIRLQWQRAIGINDYAETNNVPAPGSNFWPPHTPGASTSNDVTRHAVTRRALSAEDTCSGRARVRSSSCTPRLSLAGRGRPAPPRPTPSWTQSLASTSVLSSQ